MAKFHATWFHLPQILLRPFSNNSELQRLEKCKILEKIPVFVEMYGLGKSCYSFFMMKCADTLYTKKLI